MSYQPPDTESRAAMETLAREKAWRDFLAQIRLSLEVWRIDPDLHAHCEHVLTWARRCRDEIEGLVRS